MRELFLICVTSILCATVGFGQDKTADSETLNQQIIVLYQQGKIDDAIPLAKRVVENEKKLSKNSETHAFALTNLALLYKEKAKQLKKTYLSLDRDQRQRAFDELAKSSENGKKSLRDALEIYKSTNKDESLGAALAKSELAWMVYNFIVTHTVPESRAQIDEAERLYVESIATQEKLSGRDADQTLKTILDFGNFYMHYVNFEKALPLYEKYSAAVEKKYGLKSKGLVPVLRAFTEIYFITNRETEAKATADRISAITGVPESVVPSYPKLTLRSRKIENVKAEGFIPVDFSDDQGMLFSFASFSGALSQMGRAVIKYIPVNIVIDEMGDVIEAKVATPTKYRKEVENAALASKFRPFIYNGTGQKLRGSIVFSYFER